MPKEAENPYKLPNPNPK